MEWSPAGTDHHDSETQLSFLLHSLQCRMLGARVGFVQGLLVHLFVRLVGADHSIGPPSVTWRTDVVSMWFVCTRQMERRARLHDLRGNNKRWMARQVTKAMNVRACVRRQVAVTLTFGWLLGPSFACACLSLIGVVVRVGDAAPA